MPTLRLDACQFTPPGAGLGAHAAAPAGRLCIRTVLSGSESLEAPRRTIRLDPDTYLIQNQADAPPGRSRVDGQALWLVLSPAQVARALGGAPLPRFHEHLRLKDDLVGAQLAALEPALLAGDAPPAWLDAQCVRLVEAMLRSEDELALAARRIDCVKPATCQELMRRIRLATDFILSHYEQPLQLEDIARSAHLSRFHLVRLFRQVLGVTPHAYLLNKRASVARRLLAQHEGDLRQIALHAGFGNRWSLFRRLQRRADGRPGAAVPPRGPHDAAPPRPEPPWPTPV